MKRVLKYIIFALIAIVFIGTFVFLYADSKPKEKTYEELTVTLADIQRSTVVTGRIEPRNEVNIKPQINGIIAELYKEAGQTVQQNEVIAKLKVIPDMTSLSSAESRVRLAQINLKQAQTNFGREENLYKENLVSAEEFEQVKQQLSQAQEELRSSQDALEVIRDGVSSSNANSSSTLVRSTITGLILDVPVKVGNSVIQANTMNDGTTVAVVADMNDLIFDGQIDETEVGTLSEGMNVRITIGAIQNYSFEAVLEYIAPKAVAVNGANQFEIKAAVKPEEGKTIRSGYSANAEIVLQSVKNVPAVPESALEFDGDKVYVYLKKDGGYQKTEITTGISDGLNIEVLSGLKEGDVVRGNEIIEN